MEVNSIEGNELKDYFLIHLFHIFLHIADQGQKRITEQEFINLELYLFEA